MFHIKKIQNQRSVEFLCFFLVSFFLFFFFLLLFKGVLQWEQRWTLEDNVTCITFPISFRLCVHSSREEFWHKRSAKKHLKKWLVWLSAVSSWDWGQNTYMFSKCTHSYHATDFPVITPHSFSNDVRHINSWKLQRSIKTQIDGQWAPQSRTR